MTWHDLSPSLRSALSIAMIYLALSVLWIYFSDRLLMGFLDDPARLTLWQTTKGWLFVLLSALGIFELVRRALHSADHAQARLRDSERRYRELFECNPHPLWVYDLDSLAFLAVNDAAVTHYGYSRDEFLAMTIKDIRPDVDIPDLLRNVHQVQKGLDLAGIWRHRKKDGQVIDVEINSHTLEFNGRRAELVLAHDVTQRRRAEEEIRNLNENLERRVRERTAQLEAANRELEAFSYLVSHDLKAPLRGIDGYGKLLEKHYQHLLDEDGLRILANIRRATAMMQDLIEDLLTYSNMDRHAMRQVQLDLSSWIQEVTLEHARELETRGGQLRHQIPNLVVHADPVGLGVAVRNLLDNALKFSREVPRPMVEIGARAEKDKVILWVRDQGIGFDMRFHDRIFEIFQRLRPDADDQGTGIGLALVRKVMHRMGGRVWAESSPGQGATFYLELPQ
ncbi:sensor histidine kinase [Geoalkalibacter sp.]|uniref:sensor histidine kinase n=1 Tax=Geoalkalibacter sp. TaxID=3041440 RepID=UPI00272E7D38|nr:ATP-binding protein [Geoalkalibacter sp.]